MPDTLNSLALDIKSYEDNIRSLTVDLMATLAITPFDIVASKAGIAAIKTTNGYLALKTAAELNLANSTVPGTLIATKAAQVQSDEGSLSTQVNALYTHLYGATPVQATAQTMAAAILSPRIDTFNMPKIVSLVSLTSAPVLPVIDMPTIALSASEGNSGSTLFRFVATRSGDLTGVSSFTATVSGNGSAPATAADFVAGAFPVLSVTFPAGASSANVDVMVLGDTVVEVTEGFRVDATAPVNATLGNTVSTASIVNDDTASSGTWPSGQTDPIFVNMVASAEIFVPASPPSGATFTNRKITSGGQSGIYGDAPYVIRKSILLGREGFRLANGNTLIEDCYAEIHGILDDHGDGCQAFSGWSAITGGPCTLRRTHIKMLPGANNCGLFLADLTATDIVLEDVFIEGGANCPNGGIWMPNRPGDTGVKSLSFKNLKVDVVKNGTMGIDYTAGAVKPTIVLWDNVQTLAGGVWTQVPRPY